MPTEGNRSKRHRGIKHGPKPSSTKTGTSSSYYITSSTGAYETPEDLVRLTRHCNELGKYLDFEAEGWRVERRPRKEGLGTWYKAFIAPPGFKQAKKKCKKRVFLSMAEVARALGCAPLKEPTSEADSAAGAGPRSLSKKGRSGKAALRQPSGGSSSSGPKHEAIPAKPELCASDNTVPAKEQRDISDCKEPTPAKEDGMAAAAAAAASPTEDEPQGEQKLDVSPIKASANGSHGDQPDDAGVPSAKAQVETEEIEQHGAAPHKGLLRTQWRPLLPERTSPPTCAKDASLRDLVQEHQLTKIRKGTYGAAHALQPAGMTVATGIPVSTQGCACTCGHEALVAALRAQRAEKEALKAALSAKGADVAKTQAELAATQVTAACAVQQATAQAAQAVDAERAQNKLLQGRLVDVGRMLHLLREADPRTANALPGLIRRCGLADVVPFQDLMAPVPEASAQGDGKGGAAAAGSKKRAAQEAEAAGAAAKKTKIAADRAAAGVMVAPMASMQALAPQAIQGAAEVQHVLLQTCQGEPLGGAEEANAAQPTGMPDTIDPDIEFLYAGLAGAPPPGKLMEPSASA